MQDDVSWSASVLLWASVIWVWIRYYYSF